MNHIQQIQDWFEGNCDGDWEHENGVLIQTIDNPGWMVDINLVGTNLEGKHFELVSKNLPKEFVDQSLGLVKPPFAAASPLQADDWMICFIRNRVFHAVGDGSKLEALLEVFLTWART